MQQILPMEYPKLEKWPKNYFTMNVLRFREVIGKVVHLDIETIGPDDNGLNPYDPKTEILSIAVSVNGKQYGFRPDEKCMSSEDLKEKHFDPLKKIQRIIESPEVMVCGHNIKFDLNFLCYKFKWKMRCLAYDTMLGAYFLNEHDTYVSLEELCDRYDVMNRYKATINRRKLREMHPEDELLYNMRDTKATRLIKDNHLDPALAEHELTGMMGIGCQAIPILSKMETRGVLVDQEYAKHKQMELYEHLIDVRQDLKQLSGTVFNPDSPQKLAQVLYGGFQFNPVKYTAAGGNSVDSESIIRIRQEQCENKAERAVAFVDKLLEYNKLVGLSEKYYGKLSKWIQADGCVHTSFNIGVAVTGRLSSSNPNMQNQKRGSEFRGVYIPRPGYVFLEGDFSQIELRIAAWLAKEKLMLEMFKEGRDIHTATLCEMTGRDYEETKWLVDEGFKEKEYQEVKNLRVGIKNINFGEIYGASPERIQREMVKNGIYWTLEECEHLCKERKKLYPNIVKWKKQIENFIINHKYVRMPFGQIRRLPDANSDWKDQNSRRAIRQGINFIIQSTASGWLPIIGMILLDKYFQQNPEWDGCILLQVHDSILCEVKRVNKENMRRLKETMRLIMEVDVKEYIKEVFGVDITVPLEFKCDYLERWR